MIILYTRYDALIRFKSVSAKLIQNIISYALGSVGIVAN